MKSITELPKLQNERVIIRVDYNVPLKGNKIVDPRRIESSYKTIDAVIKKGGTPILLAHLGKGEDTLRPIASFLSKKYKIVFITEDIFSEKLPHILNVVPAKTVILLENIRRYEDEEKNGVRLSKKIASLGTYYINDAFSVSHRKHASVVGVTSYIPSYMGYQLENEIKKLSSVFSSKKHPFIFILGGSKFSTKIPLINQFLERADSIVITGAILNTFYKVAGFSVGASVVENGYEKQIKPLLKHPKILLPTDILVEREGKKLSITPDEVQEKDVIVDIGKDSIRLINEKIKKAKLVVWNGPTGWYEKGYVKATKALADAIIGSSAQAVIGGGDTGAVVEKSMRNKDAKNVFISTGGGAALDYLANGTLPGIKALEK